MSFLGNIFGVRSVLQQRQAFLNAGQQQAEQNRDEFGFAIQPVDKGTKIIEGIEYFVPDEEHVQNE